MRAFEHRGGKQREGGDGEEKGRLRSKQRNARGGSIALRIRYSASSKIRPGRSSVGRGVLKGLRSANRRGCRASLRAASRPSGSIVQLEPRRPSSPVEMHDIYICAQQEDRLAPVLQSVLRHHRRQRALRAAALICIAALRGCPITQGSDLSCRVAPHICLDLTIHVQHDSTEGKPALESRRGSRRAERKSFLRASEARKRCPTCSLRLQHYTMPLKATLNCDCGESFGQYTIVSATAGLRRLRPRAPRQRPRGRSRPESCHGC